MIQASLVKAHALKALLAYIQKRSGWSNGTMALVDRRAMGLALKLEFQAMKVRVENFQHEWLNVGAQHHHIDATVFNA